MSRQQDPLLTKASAKRKAQAGIGGAFAGTVVGGAATLLHTGRLGRQGAGAACFMAVVFGVGAALRTK